MSSASKDEDSAVESLIYSFCALAVVVPILTLLWIFWVVPGWVVVSTLVLCVLVFVSCARFLAR